MEVVNSFHSEQKTDETIEKMRGFIKEDRIDEAIEVATQT